MADFDDFDVDDFNFDESKEPSPQANKRTHDDAGLGIDEQVSVAKRPRAPAVKLDEARLLSDKGIPELRRRVKKVKFKGKGHEFSDAARLLEFYQFWLDDLFPKARFLDALAMVEKLGHKKTMRAQRIRWIDEGKPKHVDRELDPSPPPENAAHPPPSEKQQPRNLVPISDSTKDGSRPRTPEASDLPSDDVLAGGLNPRVEKTTPGAPQPFSRVSGALGESIFGSGPPETVLATHVNGQDKNGNGHYDDDLDALMAEIEIEADSFANKESDFADDEAAMAEIEGLR